MHEEIQSPTMSGQLLLVDSTFAPGASTGDRDRERRSEESGLVLSGRLALRVEGKTFTREAGDSSAFTRHGQHRCHNPGTVPAVVLWVITPPSYWHGAHIARLVVYRVIGRRSSPVTCAALSATQVGDGDARDDRAIDATRGAQPGCGGFANRRWKSAIGTGRLNRKPW